MNTLSQTELAATTGGISTPDRQMTGDIWAVQSLLDQLAAQQEAEFRRFMMGELAN